MCHIERPRFLLLTVIDAPPWVEPTRLASSLSDGRCSDVSFSHLTRNMRRGLERSSKHRPDNCAAILSIAMFLVFGFIGDRVCGSWASCSQGE